MPLAIGDELQDTTVNRLPQRLAAMLASTHSRIMDLFHLLDRDLDGSITKEELAEALVSLDVSWTEDELDDLFNHLDPDHEGGIVFRELQVALYAAQRGEEMQVHHAPAPAPAPAPASVATKREEALVVSADEFFTDSVPAPRTASKKKDAGTQLGTRLRSTRGTASTERKKQLTGRMASKRSPKASASAPAPAPATPPPPLSEPTTSAAPIPAEEAAAPAAPAAPAAVSSAPAVEAERRVVQAPPFEPILRCFVNMFGLQDACGCLPPEFQGSGKTIAALGGGGADGEDVSQQSVDAQSMGTEGDTAGSNDVADAGVGGVLVSTGDAMNENDELAELEAMLASPNSLRKSPATLARYKHFLVTEENRQLAAEVREEVADVRQLGETLRSKRMEHGHQLWEDARTQRSEAAKAHREVEQRRLQKAGPVRSDAEAYRQAAKQEREAWAEHGRQVHLAHVATHRKRLDEYKTSREQRIASENKHYFAELTEKAKREAEVQGNHIERKVDQMEIVREQMHPDLVWNSRRFFYDQRKQLANETKAATREWQSDRRLHNEQYLAKAYKSKDEVRSTRGHAIELQHEIKAHKHGVADAMMADRAEALTMLQGEAEEDFLIRKQLHDQRRAAKFASEEEALQLQASEYERLAQFNRAQMKPIKGGELKGGSSKGDWRPYW